MDEITKLLIITGFTGAGKTTFSKIVSEISKFENINTGYCLKEFLARDGLSVIYKFNIGKKFLDTYPESKVFDSINNVLSPGNSYILDGVRLYSTFKSFKNKYEKVKTVFIETNESTRTERYYRWLINDGVDAIQASSIATRKEEYYYELIKIKAESDVVFDNSKDFEQFKSQATFFAKHLNSFF